MKSTCYFEITDLLHPDHSTRIAKIKNPNPQNNHSQKCHSFCWSPIGLCFVVCCCGHQAFLWFFQRKNVSEWYSNVINTALTFSRTQISRQVRLSVGDLGTRLALTTSISYPESSGFLLSGATPGRLWGDRKKSNFLIGCSVTVSIVLPQKSCGNKIRCPQSLPGVAPLTKKPEDSGYEIVITSSHSTK